MPQPAYLYAEADAAKAAIENRFADNGLKAEIRRFIGAVGAIPADSEPTAVLLRPVATPNFETIRFIAAARELGMARNILEYNDDRFVTANIDKVHLGKLKVYLGTGRSGGEKLFVKKLFDPRRCDGRPFREIVTDRGESLVGFHHRLFGRILPGERHGDISPFLRAIGRDPVRLYENLFALAMAHWVIFENFLLTGGERRFTETVVMPAFETAVRTFGRKPAIVNLLPFVNESDVYWDYYPAAVKDCV